MLTEPVLLAIVALLSAFVATLPNLIVSIRTSRKTGVIESKTDDQTKIIQEVKKGNEEIHVLANNNLTEARQIAADAKEELRAARDEVKAARELIAAQQNALLTAGVLQAVTESKAGEKRDPNQEAP